MGFLSFKLTLVVLALRVCKPEGGRRVVTCLGDNGVRWPKAFSGGLENTKLIGGLVKAQPEARVSSLIFWSNPCLLKDFQLVRLSG